MLLPSGRWNTHCKVVTGTCYYQKADGIALVNYLILSSEILNRTSSQTCDRWYLPIFLFRDGLLTLKYRASLMNLIRFWSSLSHYAKIFKTEFVTSGVVVVKYGGWDLLMFLEPLSKCSGGSPLIPSILFCS